MLTPTIVDHWEDTKRVHIVGTLAASGVYVTGGDTVNFNFAPTFPATVYQQTLVSGSAPVWFEAQMAGYNLVGLPGTLRSTPPNAKMQVFVGTNGLELTAGAYPGGFVPSFYAIFFKI